MLIANTDIEAKQLHRAVRRRPGPRRGRAPRRRPRRVPARHDGGRARRARAARRRGGADVRRPDPAAEGPRRAAARRRRAARPATRRCGRGSSSRSSAARPAPASSTPSRWPSWPRSLGIADVVRFVPPVAQAELADWYAAATLVCVPSYNESFGLVAVEAQAAGTPVVAAAVGGLTTVVRDGVSRAARRGPRPGRLRPRRCERIVDDARPARRAVRGGALEQAATLRLGAHRRPDPRGLPARPPARCATTSRARAAVRQQAIETLRAHARRLRPRVGRRSPTASSPSSCPGEKKLQTAVPPRRRRARVRRARLRRAASPTRTTSGSTAGCSSAT